MSTIIVEYCSTQSTIKDPTACVSYFRWGLTTWSHERQYTVTNCMHDLCAGTVNTHPAMVKHLPSGVIPMICSVGSRHVESHWEFWWEEYSSGNIYVYVNWVSTISLCVCVCVCVCMNYCNHFGWHDPLCVYINSRASLSCMLTNLGPSLHPGFLHLHFCSHVLRAWVWGCMLPSSCDA